MNFFNDVYTVFWVDLRNMQRHWRSTLVSSLVLPLLYLVAFGYGLGRDVSVGEVSYLAFVVPGIVALTSFSASYSGASSKLQVDRLFYKSFDELLMSPIRHYSIILGKALIGTLRGLLSAFAILAVGLLLSPTLIVSPLFLTTLLASCFVFALFGVLIALVINSHQNMNTFSNLVILPMTFLCGTFFSLNQLPEAAKIVLSTLPLTQSSVCLRAAALNQNFPWISLAALLGFGVAFFIASMYALKKTSI
ncbi:MAG: ABC transporter permease [Candidatus Bathyarchaeia archaeon]|jgi:ABC-type multidrug transport system permease subunit